MSTADDFNSGLIDLPTAAKLLVQESTFQPIPVGYISIDGYLIDAALQEGHTFPSEITDHPVERGSDITDNIRVKPNRVTITGIVSDTPLGQMVAQRILEGSVGSGQPSDAALNKLIQIRGNADVVTIITSKKTFDDMAMENLDVPVDKNTGAALRFTATFKQVIFVTNDRQLVRVAVPQVAASQVKNGNVPSQTAEPYYTDLLGRSGNAIGDLVGQGSSFNNQITPDNLAGRNKLGPAVLSGLSGTPAPSN